MNNASFVRLLNLLEYNYPLYLSPTAFKHSMIDAVHYFKIEVFDNLININENLKRPYLNRLKYDFDQLRNHVWSNEDMLDKWYNKYGSVKESDLFFSRSNNVLYNILNSDPPSERDIFKQGYNYDIQPIQEDFYNYYYGIYLEEIICFLNDQLQQFERLRSILLNLDDSNIVSPVDSSEEVIPSGIHEPDINETIEKHLKVFSGYSKEGQKIMSPEDFTRLLSYVEELVEKERLPEKIIPIQHTRLSNVFIRKTFYEFHFELYGKKRRHYWIDFIHSVFKQFENVNTSTTSKQFTQYPNNYKTDKAEIKF